MAYFTGTVLKMFLLILKLHLNSCEQEIAPIHLANSELLEVDIQSISVDEDFGYNTKLLDLTVNKLNVTMDKLDSLVNSVAEIEKTLKPLANNQKVDCPDRFEWVVNGCYMVNAQGKRASWDTARLACQAIGGDLPVMDDLEKIYGYFYVNCGSVASVFTVWFGARRNEDLYQYANSTILPNDSSLWARGHPRSGKSGECVYLTSGMLMTDECKYPRRHVLCKYGV